MLESVKLRIQSVPPTAHVLKIVLNFGEVLKMLRCGTS